MELNREKEKSLYPMLPADDSVRIERVEPISSSRLVLILEETSKNVIDGLNVTIDQLGKKKMEVERVSLPPGQF